MLREIYERQEVYKAVALKNFCNSKGPRPFCHPFDLILVTLFGENNVWQFKKKKSTSYQKKVIFIKTLYKECKPSIISDILTP